MAVFSPRPILIRRSFNACVSLAILSTYGAPSGVFPLLRASSQPFAGSFNTALAAFLPRNLPHPLSSPINPSRTRITVEKEKGIKKRLVMAARIASPVSKLLEKLHSSPMRSAVAAFSPFRSFSSVETRDLARDTRTLEIDRGTDVSPVPRRRRRRRGGDLFPSFFSDVFDPFNPSRSLSQVLNMMDQMLDSPFGAAWGMRTGWDAREEDDALYLRVEMPGLGKEDVSVTVDQNTLVIKGEGGEEEEGKGEEEGRGRRRYSSRIDLPPNLYKLDGIKAEMKNGVLKVVVPKVKDEERKDVVQVQIE